MVGQNTHMILQWLGVVEAKRQCNACVLLPYKTTRQGEFLLRSQSNSWCYRSDLASLSPGLALLYLSDATDDPDQMRWFIDPI